MTLQNLGWDDFFQNYLNTLDSKIQSVVRVTGVRKNSFIVCDKNNEYTVKVSGRLINNSDGDNLFPVTGDWVFLKDMIITKVLPRKNALSRGASGARRSQNSRPVKEQVIAANIDIVFIVCGLDRDFNIRRIERYLTLIYNSSCIPAIVLTKSDLHQKPENFVEEVEQVAFGVPVHLVSAVNSTGIESLKKYLEPGQTVTMIGSSGAGKSTLVNYLAGSKLREIREISASVNK